MGIKQAIDIDSKQKKELLTLFNTYLPNTKIWAYGSRVKWSAKPSSDLDLVAFSKPAQASAVSKLKDALVESDLPFKVDLLIWDNIPNSFQVNIKENYFELQSDKQEGLPSGWVVVELGEVCKIITGKTPLTKKKENFGNDYMFITPRDMNNQKYIRNTERGLSITGFNSIIKSTIPKKSISVSCIGSDMGKVLITTKECATNQQINSLIVKKELPEYIYYYLFTKQDEIKNHASGSAIPIMNKTAFSQLRINLPPLPEQKAIAHILGKLDDKIELNRQINQTLETTAQTLFKSWFVNFDPVIDNAIKSGNPIPDPLKPQAQKRKTTKSTLPKTTQDLFPNRFVFNDKLNKWIPDGWAVSNIGKECDFLNGNAFKSKELLWESDGDSYHVFKMGNILKGGGFNYSGTKSYYAKKHSKKLSKYLLKKGDVLMAMTDMKSNMALLGHTALMPLDDVFLVNQRVGTLRAKESSILNFSYIYLFTNYPDTIIELRSRSNSGVQVNLSTSAIKETLVLVPSEKIHSVFNEYVANTFENIFFLGKQTQTLIKLRDTLLPKLISGKIRVLTSRIY